MKILDTHFLALACLLSKGHLLIEDVPGTGKTLLAKNLAQKLGVKTTRLQCTNDLLPSDILGYNFYDQEKKMMIFKKGPIFSQVLLADELNRAPSKTQSALLEAMEEGQVSIEGETYQIEKPFFVIATQNPREHVGVFDLPESQIDRFYLSLKMNELSRKDYKTILTQDKYASPFELIKNIPKGSSNIIKVQSLIEKIHMHTDVLEYQLTLVEKAEEALEINLAIRYRKQLYRLSQSIAYLSDRDFVTPDDIQAVFIPSLRHRCKDPSDSRAIHLLEKIVKTTKVP
jgi:MoxR-like ATPase